MHFQSNCPHTWQWSTDRSNQGFLPQPYTVFRSSGHSRGTPCLDVTKDTIVDKKIRHTAAQLNTLAYHLSKLMP